MKSIKTSSMKEKVDEKILREQVSSIIEDIRNNKDVALKNIMRSLIEIQEMNLELLRKK